MTQIKALFVDDDDGILEALNLYAEMKQIPLFACRPEGAAELVKNNRPEVIFFDYLMAGTDGPGLLKEIRSQTDAEFKAILVTAHPLIETMAKERFAGWIKKPFSFAELEKYVTPTPNKQSSDQNKPVKGVAQKRDLA